MARLRDDRSTDPTLAAAARLVRAADPGEPPPGLQARMLAGVRRPRTAPAALSPWLRPAFALGVLLLVTVAGATAHVWRARRVARSAAIPTPAPAASATRSTAPGGPPDVPAPDAPTVPTVTPPFPTPARSRAPAARPAMIHEPSPTPKASPASAAPAPTAPVAAPVLDPEAALLQSAVRALRHHGDARRAAQLIDDYLVRYPHGDLAEEALALGVEAHVTLADGRAAALADDYLARFPRGRFRAAVSLARAR